MVNIAKISGLAGKAFSLLKPTTSKAVKVAIFGAGAGAGYLVSQNNSQRVVSPQTTEQVADSTVTKPKQEQGEKEFTYVPPKIGEDGIVKADTSYYAGTKQPESIDYNDKDDITRESIEFDKNGKMKGFWKRSHADGQSEGEWYNEKGELKYKCVTNADGSYTWSRKVDDIWLDRERDKNGRLTSEEYYNDDDRYEQRKMTYDKNDRLVKEKHYDIDGLLKYTVVPKYNKDGDLVKNDTIRNKNS